MVSMLVVLFLVLMNVYDLSEFSTHSVEQQLEQQESTMELLLKHSSYSLSYLLLFLMLVSNDDVDRIDSMFH